VPVRRRRPVAAPLPAKAAEDFAQPGQASLPHPSPETAVVEEGRVQRNTRRWPHNRRRQGTPLPLEVEAFLTGEADDASTEDAMVVTAHCVDARPSKRKHRDCTSMTAEEARAQALQEGLTLVTSATAISGFYQVVVDHRGKAFPYAVYTGQSGASKGKGAFLGSYATAEEAALVYARYVGNTEERCVTAGQHERSRDAIASAQGFTLVCRRHGCGTLVDLWRAKIEAGDRQHATYALDDGCGACARHKPGCSKHFKLQRWQDGQVKMARALLEGKRRLIAWPSGPAQSTVDDVLTLVKGADEAQAVAEGILTKYRAMPTAR